MNADDVDVDVDVDVDLDLDLDGAAATESTTAVIRRGLASVPEIRDGLALTVLLTLLGGAGRVAVPILIQQALDRGLADGHIGGRTLAVIAPASAIVVLGTAVVSRISLMRLAVASEHALCGLRIRAFEHVHRLSVAYHSDQARGRLVARVTADVETLSTFLQWGGIAWIVNGAIMAASLVAMLVYDVWLAVVAVGLLAPLALLVRVLAKRLGLAHRDVRASVARLYAVVSEMVAGAPVIRAYGIEERAGRRAAQSISAWRGTTTRSGYIGGALFGLGDLFAAITTVGVIALGLAIGPAGGLSVGKVVAFILLVSLFLAPVTEFTEIIDFTQNAAAGWRRVLALLAIVEDVPDPDPGRTLPPGPPALAAQHVWFGYREGAAPALADVSFEVAAGQRVALIGATGSGKTTLIKLLARLADPDRGRILIGGIDAREITSASLRDRLVVVPQEAFLFDATVAENVLLGRNGAGPDDVARAFADLGLEAFAAGLPQGLDTPVGQRGERLSMGERQLVALARARLADPDCLILDEATSAVDPEIELALAEALGRLTAGRTSITVAHRLATAERADEILVLAHGRLTERGPHRELLAAGGAYAALHHSWRRTTSDSALHEIGEPALPTRLFLAANSRIYAKSRLSTR